MSDGDDGPRGHGCARASAQVQEVGTASRLQGKGSENCYMGKFIVLLQMCAKLLRMSGQKLTKPMSVL